MKTQTKLISFFTAVLFFLLLVWGSAAYWFFAENTWRNSVRTDTMELNQYMEFLKEKSGNIENYVNKLVINERLQTFMKEVELINSSSEKNSYISGFFREFSDEISIDTSIQSMVVVTAAGNTYWSQYPFTDEFSDYWEKIAAGHEEDISYYSTPYEIFSGFTRYDVVSYVTRIKDVENFNECIGYLIINIHFGNWAGICQRMEAYYDSVTWNVDGNIWYQSASQNTQDRMKSRSVENYCTLISYPDKSYQLLLTDEERSWELSVARKYANVVDKGKYIRMFTVFFLAGGIAIVLLLLLLSDTLYTKPIRKLVGDMEEIKEGNFDYTYEPAYAADMRYLGDNLRQMASQLKLLIDKRVADEKNIRDLELEVLLLQINPHFIYNTLNTVIYIARREKCESIERLMKSFIVLLKDVLPGPDQQSAFVTVERELHIVEHYCVVQNYRYPNMIELRTEVSEQALREYIPKAILQPLVENAILHGIFPAEERGYIRIKADVVEDNIVILVENDGVSIEEETIKRIYNNELLIKTDGMVRSIGIENVLQRLSLYYTNHIFHINRLEGGGTQVQMRIPRRPEKQYECLIL